MSENMAKVRERSGNLCSRGNLIEAVQQNNLLVLYSCCNSFFISDVHREFGLINVVFYNILPAISSGKVKRFFYCISDAARVCSLTSTRKRAIAEFITATVLNVQRRTALMSSPQSPTSPATKPNIC